MTSLLSSDKITSNYSKIPSGPKKTNPKLIEWCLKVGIYKSKSLLNIVYVIYFEVFCKVLSQNIKYWTSYDIFSSGIDIDNACKKKIKIDAKKCAPFEELITYCTHSL